MRIIIGVIALIQLAYCQNIPAVVPGWLNITLLDFSSVQPWNYYANGAVRVRAMPIIATSSDIYAPSWTNGLPGYFLTAESTDPFAPAYAQFGNSSTIVLVVNNPTRFLTFETHIDMIALSTSPKDLGWAKALFLSSLDFTNVTTPTRETALLPGGEKIDFIWSYACSQPNYYGLGCDVYCVPQNLSFTCYYCSPLNGTKICCNDTIYDSSNDCQLFVQSTTTTTTSPSTQQQTTTVSCASLCYSTIMTTITTQAWNCSTVSPGNEADDNDKENLYFWLMVGTAALALVLLIFVIIVICWCCICYRKTKVSPYRAQYQYSNPYRPPNDPVYQERKAPAPMPRDPPAMTLTSRYDALSDDGRPYSEAPRTRRDDVLQYSAPRRKQRRIEPPPREPSYNDYPTSEADMDATNDDSNTFDGYQTSNPPHFNSRRTVATAGARPVVSV